MQRPSIKYVIKVSSYLSIFISVALIYYVNIKFVSKSFENLMDFGSFIASGQFVSEGKNPYSNDSPLIFTVSFPKIDHFGSAPNLNPPISVLVFNELAKIPPITSVQVWRIASIIFYIAALYIFWHNQEGTEPQFLWRTIWMFGLAGFWHTIELGQIYILLLLLALGVVIYSEKGKPILAGILLGSLIAIKPNFIFWAVALGIAGYWQTFFFAGITALFISLIPVYFYGLNIYKQWFEASSIFTPNLLIFPGNNSFQGLTAHFGNAEAGIIISIIFSLIISVVIYKFRPAVASTNTLAIITSLLISPIAWTGYTLFLLPVLMKTKKWEWHHWCTAVIFSVPFFVILGFFQDNFFNFVFFGWFYGWGLLILLTEELLNIIKKKPEAVSA